MKIIISFTLRFAKEDLIKALQRVSKKIWNDKII